MPTWIRKSVFNKKHSSDGIKSLGTITFLGLFLVGCSSFNFATTAVDKTTASTIKTSRVTTGECIFLPQKAEQHSILGAVAGALVEPVIGVLYDSAVAGIELAGQDQSVTYSAHQNLISDFENLPECVRYTRGSFVATPDAGINSDVVVTLAKGSNKNETDLKKFLEDEGLIFSSMPEMFLEMRILKSGKGLVAGDNSSKSAFYFKTTRLLYKPGTQSLGTGNQFVVTASIRSIDDVDGKSKIVPGIMKFGEVSAGTDLYFREETSGKASLVTGPGTFWLTSLVTDAPSPYSISVEVAETRKGNEYARRLAEALSKPDVRGQVVSAVVDPIKDRVNPNEDARRTAAKANLDTFTASYSKAITDLNACGAVAVKGKPTAERIQAVATAETSIRQANFDAEAASLRKPFPNGFSLSKLLADAEGDASILSCPEVVTVTGG